MKQLLTICSILNIGLVTGQNFSYPTIQHHEQTISKFIPNGWTLLRSALGDLNNDKNEDLAFVIQYRDSISLIKTDDGYIDTVITQPRILILAFYNTVTKQYDVIEQSNSFILNHDNPNMDEPFQSISISSGVLKIDFTIFMNMGGWGMSNNTYKFRYRNNQFQLIGSDYNYTNRRSGNIENRSYNFSTKKVKISTGNISNDKQKIIWRTINLQEIKTLKTFKQPFTWEVEKDFNI